MEPNKNYISGFADIYKDLKMFSYVSDVYKIWSDLGYNTVDSSDFVDSLNADIDTFVMVMSKIE